MLVARGPDIYGPGITGGSFYGELVFGKAVEGKPIDFIGKLDKRHATVFAPDYVKAVVKLALDESAYGQTWHIPHAEAITQQEFADLIFEEIGSEIKVRAIPNFLLVLLSLFNKPLREVKEMRYEFEQEYLVDTSKFITKYGSDVTSHKDAVKLTVKWYKRQM